MRLIDADALMAEIEDLREPNDPYEHDQYLVGQMFAWNLIEDAVKDAPTVVDTNPDEIILHVPNTWRGKLIEWLAADGEPEQYTDMYCPGDICESAPTAERPSSCEANKHGHDISLCATCWNQKPETK